MPPTPSSKRSRLAAVDPMTKARTELVMSEPFFGTLLLRLKMQPDLTVKTANINGQCLRYNPEWVETLKPDQRRGMLIHEIMHMALGHHIRRGNREPAKWNKACDYAINPLLDKKYILPNDACNNPAYAGMSAEQIYTKLPDEPPGKGNDPGGCGGVEDNPADTTPAQAEAQLKQHLATARYVAQQHGKVPAFVETLVTEALAPVVNWKDALRRFCQEKTPANETWAKGNRRFLAQGLYLPSRSEDQSARVAVVVRDTSGSIYGDPGLLAQFNGELEQILADVNPQKTYVIDCDAAMQRVIEIGPGEEMPAVIGTAVGGGGTSFVPPFKWLKEQGINPSFVTYLTDGYGDFPSEEQVGGVPVLWAMTTDVTAPVGETLPMDLQPEG